MSKELRLIKAEFCRLRNLPLDTPLDFQQQGRDYVTQNMIFAVSGPGLLGERYVHERISLKDYSQHETLKLDAELRLNHALLNKDNMAAWFGRVTGIQMLADDIGQLIINDTVTVVASANSMRFRHSFSMAFK
ncbi:hypothetical protein D3C81_479410 [compost metagenome]